VRIATSTIFDSQTQAIDNLTFQQNQLGTEISSGKSLNEPSDDPTQIAQDLTLHTTIATENTTSTNLTSAVDELTSTDSALSNLTNVLQSARELAVQGASEALTASQRQSIAGQVDQLLTQAIGVANTNYAGQYIFAGTSTLPSAPVIAKGSPTSSVTFTGNFQTQSQVFQNGQSFTLSTTLQEAFNYDSSDGTPDVFSVLQNLRDTLSNGTVVDQSATSVNQQNTVINSNSTLGPGANQATLATALTADSSGDYSISINGTPPNGASANVLVTFLPTDTMADVVAKINAVTAQTGVSASFDVKTQKLVLSTQNEQPFYVTDASSPGATNTANFVEAFGLTTNADFVQNLSTQLGDIDNVLNTALNARAVIGGRIDALNTLSSQNSQAINNNTTTQSQIEDTDVASAVTQFTQTQTALDAAYSTTSRLESKILFDYLGTT
jgi:flagellar hook-associated protein 3 FlgL